MPAVRGRGFTLLELLVVVSIIAMLTATLIPTVNATLRSVKTVTCASNLRQVGTAIQAYRSDNSDRLPSARYMPAPFVSVDTDPGLPEALRNYIRYDDGKPSAVWQCPDDDTVFDLAGTSYDYISAFSGQKPGEIIFIQWGVATESEIILSRDFDDAAADVEDSDEPLEIPKRHLRRNNLWLDGHVGVIEFEE